ncbi:MAG: hypothetical protein A4S09_08945 [Proteobacteria bacterium SG_bin7]|nr:MAG: hypothetical protein A4S09_08945 [Proteobacteria bacterium SG_bin7]
MTLKSVLFVFLFSSTSIAATCNSGYKAYTETLYPKIMQKNRCVECHNGSNPKAPPFAVPEIESSYELALRYMNFAKIDESLLTYRAGNGHCAKANCDFDVGIEFNEISQMWWDKGENACNRNGKYFSAEVVIPTPLPPANAGFKTILFDLSPISNEFKDMKLALEIQEYVKTSENVRGAYRVKYPRIVNGEGNIYIKDMKVLLNGMYDSIYNTYTIVDKTTTFVPVELVRRRHNEFGLIRSATPVISGSPLIIVKDGLANSKLQISFMEISRGNKMVCNKNAMFTNIIMPALKSLSCSECHNSSLDDLGSQVFDLTKNIDQACLTATALTEKSFPSASALLSIPTKGLFGHPQLSDQERTNYTKIIKEWLHD